MKIDPKDIRPGDRIKRTTEWEAIYPGRNGVAARLVGGDEEAFFAYETLAQAEITRPVTFKPGDRVRIGELLGTLKDGVAVNGQLFVRVETEFGTYITHNPSDLIPAEEGEQ